MPSKQPTADEHASYVALLTDTRRQRSNMRMRKNPQEVEITAKHVAAARALTRWGNHADKTLALPFLPEHEWRIAIRARRIMNNNAKHRPNMKPEESILRAMSEGAKHGMTLAGAVPSTMKARLMDAMADPYTMAAVEQAIERHPMWHDIASMMIDYAYKEVVRGE